MFLYESSKGRAESVQGGEDRRLRTNFNFISMLAILKG